MSKNYTNYSKMTMPEVVEELETAVGLVETEEAQEVTEEIMEQPALTVEEIAEEEVPTTDPVYGTVNATKLNVRKFPSLNAEVLEVTEKNREVQIDAASSTADWYKVCTEAGVEGYCMKKFISIK